MSAVRSLLGLQADEMRELLHELEIAVPGPAAAGHTDGEIDRVLQGEFGPILEGIQGAFVGHIARLGVSDRNAEQMWRQQVHDWLLCCSPSRYTLPLLMDGLAQLLNEAPEERESFVEGAQRAVQDNLSKLTPTRKAASE